MQMSRPESMTADQSFTFLGTGTSVGVPVIGCGCGVCRSDDPKNQRLRSAAVVRLGGHTLLIDSGPDLRAQALRQGLREIDAVVYTHSHLDHVAGFDELRAFCWHRPDPLPMHATRDCMDALVNMFGWAFSEENVYKGYVKPDPRIIDGPFHYGNLKVTPLPVEHAAVPTIGLRFDHPGARSIAYLPDVKHIPNDTMWHLKEVDILVIDALRPQPHPTHFSVGEALAAIRDCQPGEAWLTHLGHENDHQTLAAQLPAGVRVAWDGLQLPL
jgi:phosphoribosyl 1,2-cyclic phosphate phosphodiesterase